MSYPAPKALSHWQDHEPKAVTNAALLSPGKLSAIRGIANSQRIYPDDACRFLFGCLPHELCWMAADTYIAWLKAQEKQLSLLEPPRFCPLVACRYLQTEREEAAKCGNGHSFEIAEPINRPLNEHSVGGAN